MITATITSFWRGIDFESGQETAKISLRLPGGLVIEAPVPPAYLQTLVDAVDDEKEPAQEAAPRAVPVAVESSSPEEEESDPMAELVTWAELPEDVLPNHVKYAFADTGLPPQVSAAQVLQIRDAIVAEYTDSDWARLEAKITKQQPTPRSPPAPRPPPIGVVEWGEGSIMRPSVPSRTVPKDEKGYPIVKRSANEVDPGEVAASADDDGVEQF